MPLFFCTILLPFFYFFFFFNDTATTEIYTLSLHDALPILGQLPKDLGTMSLDIQVQAILLGHCPTPSLSRGMHLWRDRKSTRLNSSHDQISYAVFCLKKKKKKKYRENGSSKRDEVFII